MCREAVIYRHGYRGRIMGGFPMCVLMMLKYSRTSLKNNIVPVVLECRCGGEEGVFRVHLQDSGNSLSTRMAQDLWGIEVFRHCLVRNYLGQRNSLASAVSAFIESVVRSSELSKHRRLLASQEMGVEKSQKVLSHYFAMLLRSTSALRPAKSALVFFRTPSLCKYYHVIMIHP